MSCGISIITITLLTLIVGFVVVYSVIISEDPGATVFKWIFTGVIAFVMVWKVMPMVAAGGYGAAFGGIPFAAVCGLALAFTWRRTIAGWIANPIASLYDGGMSRRCRGRFDSVAQARQKQGKFYEAVLEVRRQLDRFPTDFEGHILLAEIQAEDLKDLNAAEMTIQTLCAQPGHAPINIVFALYSMADWHLKHAQDREAARGICNR